MQHSTEAPRTRIAARLAAHPLLAWGGAFVVLLLLPLAVLNGYQQYLLDLIMINVVLAVGLNIVKGFAGQVNVGHVALAAIGAYTSAVLSAHLGVPFWFALPLATLATGAVGAIVGVPSFRLEGAYLALATLGLAESVRMFIAVTDTLGASIGFGDIPPPMLGGHRVDSYYAYYYIVMPIAFVGTYLAYSILRSDVGRAFMAIREDSLAAAASGINVRKYKLLAFLISALYAGCAGSLTAHMAPGFIHPDDFNLTRMVTVILMVVAGGLGHVWGGVIGAAAITLISEWARAYYQYQFIIFGLIVVLTMMYMPRGLGGWLDRRRVMRRFIALRQQGGPQGSLAGSLGTDPRGTGDRAA
jgi:branched-chain amino acid transport system permease protein